MAITTTTPISASVFNLWWIKNANLFTNIPVSGSSTTNLNLAFVPFNGTYALSTTPSRLNLNVDALKTTDATFNGVYNGLVTEIQRQYTVKNPGAVSTFVIKTLNVMAQNPDRPVSIFVQALVNGAVKTFMINDVFALAGTDSTFAVVLNNTMNEFGRQGKVAGIIS